MAISFQGAQVPPALMLLGVRGSVAEPLSTRHVAARLEARGAAGEHATLQRGGINSSPPLEEALPRRQRPVWGSGRMAETARKGKGQWR